MIGKGLKIYRKLAIRGDGLVVIGDNCTVSGMRGDPIQHVTLYTLSRDAQISIGNDVRLYAARLSSKFSIKIGDNVLIEESGIMDTDFHSIERQRGTPINENRETCSVSIGSGVLIGARTIITKGVNIGDYSVIGPGSIVSRSIPPSSFALGNPAKIINNNNSETMALGKKTV